MHDVPGKAVPPGTPRQSTTCPTHWHVALHVSFTVFALPSLHAVPGMAGPLITPLQSVTTPLMVNWPREPRLRFQYDPLKLVSSFSARTMYFT